MNEHPRDAEAAAGTSRALEDFVARLRPEGLGLTPLLERAAVEALEKFAAQDVGALLLKGPALARELYTTSERRDYSDIDLLVAPADLPMARKALTRLGYRNASAPLGIDDIGGVVHEENWIGGVAPHEVVIELHLRLPGSRAAPQSAWKALRARSTVLELRGSRVPALSRDALAMHLATHAAQHGPQYVKGCSELELGLERWPFVVWKDAAALASEIDATEAFAAGLRLVPRGAQMAATLGLPPDGRLAWEIRQAERPRGTFHLEALLRAHVGLRARANVLRRALLPQRAWIAWQYPWARERPARLVAAYALHLMRTPVWAARAWWWFRSRARHRG